MDNLSKSQINILNRYNILFKNNNSNHLTTGQIDRTDSYLRKEIVKLFGGIENFRIVFNKLFNIDCEDNNEFQINDVDRAVYLLNKQLYKKDNYIKELKKQKDILMSQTCNQDNHYDYIIKRLPKITYKHIDIKKIVNYEYKKGTAILHLSDLHYGEVVQMGSTLYDCAIAEARLSSIIKQFCNIVKDYEKAVIFVNGDMINGNIHSEFDKTNEMTIIDTILRLSKLLSEHFLTVWEHFKGNLDIVFTVGNHARTIPGDIYYKNKVKENWEYLLGNMVKHNIENANKYINVEVSNTPSIVYQVEDTRFAITHGDCFKSLNNIRVGVAKFQEMNMSTIGPFDHLLIGHFHSTKIENGLGGKIFANGCFKECDEYSTAHLFSICPPEQTCLIVEKNEIKSIIILNALK